jgi:hypothetical protein
LQKWVPADTYATTDPDTLAILQNAEAHLAMHFAVLGFNSPISAKGVFITETSTEGKAVRRYLAPKETAELASMYLDTAQNMVMDYMTTDGTPAAPFETIDGSSDCTIDTSCEAVSFWTRSCG